MTPLDLQSEQYSATGNVASEGVLNQLGRPNLDMLTVLVRETVQNSWDARITDNGTVHFGMSGRTLTDEQMQLLKQVIFANQFGQSSLNTTLSTIPNFQVLAVYDRGTTGLVGPTRADRAVDDVEPRKFVNFLRNVGMPPDKRFGGGTFGYGKAALYLASRIRTICVHTHCLSRGQLEKRFMAAALGPRYETKGACNERYLYTGRHWWGRNEEGVVEPIRGIEADELADQLGLPGFTDEEYGTTILILLPLLGERSLLQTLQLAGTHILWNCWPKMLKLGSNNPSMTFKLAYNEQSISIPDPHKFPPLQGFAQAMENLKSRPSDIEDSILSQIVPIECYSPKQLLGQLSLQRFEVKERQEQLTNSEEVFPFSGLSHHVALMRKPELVVKYVQGPPLPTGQLEYAGVFIVDEQMDDVFAKAEPPTHDDWAFQSLDNSREKTFVRVALRRIQESLQSFTLPPLTSNKAVGILPLGAFADRLGGLLLGSEGSGASIQPFNGMGSESRSKVGGEGSKTKETRGSGDREADRREQIPHSRGRQKARINLLKTETLGFVGDIPARLIEFIVEHAPDSQATEVKVDVSAVLDDDELEKDPPVGEQVPRILLWLAPDKSRYAGSSQIKIPASSTGTWGVAVSILDDAVISVNLTISEVL
jgi:hypothetical protein